METRTRAGLAATAVLALGMSFAAGAALGGGSGPSAGPTTGRTPPPGVTADPIRLTGSGLLVPPTSDCDELLKVYVDKAKDVVGPYGWGGGGPLYAQRTDENESAAADSAIPEALSGSAPAMEAATSSETGTNVQEAGVDEPDHVKTDGRLLFRIDDGRITAYDVTGAEPVEVGDLGLDALTDGEILLAGETLVAIGTEPGGRWERPRTRIVRVSVADPSAMEILEEQSWSTELVTARQHGDVVRVMARTGLPDLDFVEPGRWRNERRALARNQEIIEDSEIDDWLPQVTTYSADGEERTERLLECGEVSVPDSDSGLSTLAVVGFDATSSSSSAGTASRIGVLAATDLVYTSADRLYVATAPSWGWCCDVVLRGGSRVSADVEYDGKTRVHAFALAGTETSYVASGAVDGQLKDRWSMDEYDGVLRLAVGPTRETGNFNSVVMLEESGDRLAEIGRVDKLGVDEDIKSMRWFDEMAVMVTFRQVDPLYAIDLRDPAAPELLGELKIPGFSEYLHPLGTRRIIGIGQDADERTGQTKGAQAAVFDLIDVTNPIQASVVKYDKNTVAGAATDPRQFTWLPERRTALTVISRGWEGRTGWVSVLRMQGGALHNELIEVEYGADVDQVRLVPLPSSSAGAPGRVVLVTGDDLSFLPLI